MYNIFSIRHTTSVELQCMIHDKTPIISFYIAVTACVFPNGMRGRWYQSRYGELEISHNEITRKGTCAQKEDNKYLLYNRYGSCLVVC